MEPSPDSHRRGGGWIGWVVGLIVLVVLSAIAIPGVLHSGRASNFRNAWASLKTISSAEADFRANDRDGNRVNDFWTGDVKGLYTMTSPVVRGTDTAYSTTDPPIKLIELSIALADADGSLVPAGGENLSLTLFGNPNPKAGYWYAALTRDLSVSNPAESTYKVETGGTPLMGSCHHASRFGFVTFPNTVQSGEWAFILNESNVVYRSPVKSPIRTGNAMPPGLNGFSPAYQTWPDEPTLKKRWSKAD